MYQNELSASPVTTALRWKTYRLALERSMLVTRKLDSRFTAVPTRAFPAHVQDRLGDGKSLLAAAAAAARSSSVRRPPSPPRQTDGPDWRRVALEKSSRRYRLLGFCFAAQAV
ncbi:MAG: hypothetical protein EBS51_01045 [Planctomycetia bacterium]|nr:hypothetical protein [Planctomycetia bacterium]